MRTLIDGKKIREIRTARGMTQGEAALAMKIARPNYVVLETKPHPAVGMDTALRLCSALGCSLYHIMPDRIVDEHLDLLQDFIFEHRRRRRLEAVG